MDEPLYRCAECRKSYRGTPHRTTVNRKLCPTCAKDAFAIQLGGLMGASQGAGQQVTYAVAFRNLFRRARDKALRRQVTTDDRSTPADEAAPH
jgi:hypothetical protein